MKQFSHSFAWLMLLLASATLLRASLLVKVQEPKRTGNKAVFKLEMKNTFAEKVESARATVFLLDEQGKIVGQATQWVIGGTKDRPPLAPDGKTTYNIVVPVDRPYATHRLLFNRLTLEGGKRVDVQKSVEIEK